MRLAVSLVLIFIPALIPVAAQSSLDAGRRAYEVCAGCHGFVGEGSRLVGAPRLSGIETWYLERQIQNFIAQRRGYDENDTDGQRMALMAQAVHGDRELGDLLAWIDALPTPAASAGTVVPASMSAEISRGESLYAVCSGCHGTDGRGNESLAAPGLVSLDDWYFVEQLRLYAEGLRGTHPEDPYGAQMRAVASSFDTNDERQTLVSYVNTLPRDTSETAE